jgi:type II secretory pathway pseudopilin PulG
MQGSPEMVCVIPIIAMLAAILLPHVSRATSRRTRATAAAPMFASATTPREEYAQPGT